MARSLKQPTWNSLSQVSQIMMVRSPKAPRRKSGSWHSTQPLPKPSVSCTTSGGLQEQPDNQRSPQVKPADPPPGTSQAAQLKPR
jgi:hypothetical protein